jgi:hypothetical protein
MGLFASGTEYATMIRAPEKMPAEPTPAKALPMMRAIELGATPQTKLPSSKTPIAIKYTHLIEKYV